MTPPLARPALAIDACTLPRQAVRKMLDAKKLESSLDYDSAFGSGGKQ